MPPPFEGQLEMALNALIAPQRRPFLRACAIDVLPLWPAPPEIVDYLWSGTDPPSDALFARSLSFDSRIEQAASLAAFGEINAWYHAARAESYVAGSYESVLQRQIACARALELRPAVDLSKYRLIWDAFEQRMPLTEILMWGEPEDAWVEADRRLS